MALGKRREGKGRVGLSGRVVAATLAWGGARTIAGYLAKVGNVTASRLATARLPRAFMCPLA